jgi:polygalacturonase
MRGAWTRRDVLRTGLLVAGAAALPRCRFQGSAPPPLPANLPTQTPWPEANALLAATKRPIFPSATFAVTDFGARGDGQLDDTAAFDRAIAACTQAGGGHVTVPAGRWLVGAVRLRSNVDLQLAPGATLLFSADASLYPPVLTRYEGIECINHSPMIYAFGETNVAVTGSGVLDGSRTGAWNSGSDRSGVLEPLVARGVPPEQRVVVGQLRVACVEPYRCANVLLQGVTLVGAPFWQLHPTLCTDVTIDGVTTTVAGENSDGCDPESCTRVVIQSSTLASGDDNIAIKSGRDADGRRVATPCRDLVILNCQAEGRFGFITCGSEQTGGIENVYAFNLWTYGQGVGSALWVKSNTQRGGFTRNVNIDTFTGAGFRSGVVAVSMTYADQQGDFPPIFSDYRLSRFRVTGAPYALDLQGLPSDPIGPITVSDSQFLGIDTPIRIENAAPVSWSNVLLNGQRIP